MLGEEDRQSSFLASQEAVDATLEDHPDRAVLFSNLGIRLGDRYSETGAMTDLEEARSYFQFALRQSNSLAIHRISAGKLCSSVLRDHFRLTTSLRGFSHGCLSHL